MPPARACLSFSNFTAQLRQRVAGADGPEQHGGLHGLYLTFTLSVSNPTTLNGTTTYQLGNDAELQRVCRSELHADGVQSVDHDVLQVERERLSRSRALPRSPATAMTFLLGVGSLIGMSTAGFGTNQGGRIPEFVRELLRSPPMGNSFFTSPESVLRLRVRCVQQGRSRASSSPPIGATTFGQRDRYRRLRAGSGAEHRSRLLGIAGWCLGLADASSQGLRRNHSSCSGSTGTVCGQGGEEGGLSGPVFHVWLSIGTASRMFGIASISCPIGNVLLRAAPVPFYSIDRPARP